MADTVTVEAIADHTYEGQPYAVGDTYAADAAELDNLQYHVRFAVPAEDARRREDPEPAEPPKPRKR